MPMKTSVLMVFVVAMGAMGAVRVFAEELPREALVMGVEKYQDAIYEGKAIRDLAGITTADLPLMKEKLESLGFRVRLVSNPTWKEAEQEVEAFSARIKERPGVSLFYFSGHGGEYKGKNYLLLRESRIWSAEHLEDNALNAQRVLDGMEKSGATVNLMFLDCSRENLGKNIGGAESGPLNAPRSFVGFATQSGDGVDSEVEGSIYTRFLLKHMGTPGISVSDMYAGVISDVKQYSKDVLGTKRRPVCYSELDAPFYFVPASFVKSGEAAGRAVEERALMAEQGRLEEERRKLELVKLETERRALEEGRKRLEMAKLTPPKTVVPPPAADPDAGPAKAETGAVGKTLEVGLPGGKVMRFCYCPAGKFTMGSPVSEPGHSNDENQVSVTISQGFWMAETEVTQGQWQSVIGSNPSRFKGASLPVEQVSWEDAQEMVRKLNQTSRPPSGFKFALPTEAQWEYACRAGTQTAYAFGSQLTPQKANFGKGAGGQTVAVMSYGPNRWGLYEMHGNVWEWCSDWRGDGLQGGVDPRGDSSGVSRVIRGGGWDIDAVRCRAADRDGNAPGYRLNVLGFRPALVPSR